MTYASSLYLFAFERAQPEPLAFMPLGVRFYLDRCGYRLSLAQWQALPEGDRATLARIEPAFDEASATAFARVLEPCVSHASIGPVETQACEDVETLAPAAVPDTVIAQAAQHGVDDIAQQAWSALTIGQRYALAKLARKARRSEDFGAAMTEFGLRAH
ncbi:nitrate reductase associated protein [Pararobbsia silviterrae]|uniref:Uncharacterized protein n=1 Tax=Pararobbsia silviterrae TaxID=1792498 RepID=A0A494YFV4_9BURK|nr:nitrate reductase associated protein [Pararobbsia silviterrae]RKP58917.1 hypothetical protein D7S86_03060 [Pararobbsia silviterrae]